jgi:hydroxymethylbilane synthase
VNEHQQRAGRSEDSDEQDLDDSGNSCLPDCPRCNEERLADGEGELQLHAKDSPYAGLVLARVGLQRIGAVDEHQEFLPVEFQGDKGTVSMVPPVGAGIVGVHARVADTPVMQLVNQLNHPSTAAHVLAERTMLHMLRGHCNSPIAGYATTTPDGQMSLFGMVFNQDGSQFVRSHAWGDPGDPATLGARVAADLLHQGAMNLIDATRK